MATTLLSVAYDPYSLLPTASAVVTLSFTQQGTGAAYSPSGLNQPITFSLPASSTSDPSAGADVCQFFNTTLGTYDTAGCVSMPISPPGASISWSANASTPTDASLAGAWTISGPLAEGCTSHVLDCSGPDASTAVRLNPANEDDGFGSCNNQTTAVRIFSGEFCALWRPPAADGSNSSTGCHWNTTVQNFVGPGCSAGLSVGNSTAAAPVTTQCACRHATEFASAPKLVISTATPKDLVDFTPDDIIKRLKPLFIIVICAFGGMHLLIIVGFWRDLGITKRTLAAIHEIEFVPPIANVEEETSSGEIKPFLWLIAQRGLSEPVGVVRGSMVHFANIVGIPPARLRMAVPEEFLPHLLEGQSDGLTKHAPRKALHPVVGDHASSNALRQIVGHLGGFDTEHAAEAIQRRRRVEKEARRRERAAAKTEAELKAVKEAQRERRRERARQRRNNELFAAALLSPDPRAEEVQASLLNLVDPLGAFHHQESDLGSPVAQLPPRPPTWQRKTEWLAPPPSIVPSPMVSISESLSSVVQAEKAAKATLVERGLTREVCFSTALVLSYLQHNHLLPVEDLEARRASAAAMFDPHGATLLPPYCTKFDDLVDCLLGMWLQANISKAGDWIPKAQLWRIVLLSHVGRVDRKKAGDAVVEGKERTVPAAHWEMSDSLAVALQAHTIAGGPEAGRCPLAFTSAAALKSSRRPKHVSDTVWCTALVAARLNELPVSWLVTGTEEIEEDGAHPATMLDAALAWLNAKGRPRGGVDALLAAAAEQIQEWDKGQLARCTVLRKESYTHPRFFAYRPLPKLLSFFASMMWALRTKHETFSFVTNPFVSELRYRQKACTVVTSIIALLTVQIWFYYTRAKNCCQEIRLSFGCVADTTVDCAIPGTNTGGGQAGGGSADCQKLLAYADPSWTCSAFPRDGLLRDTVLCALISVACTMPVNSWLEFLFIMQNEAGTRARAGARWLTATGLVKFFGGKPGWRYATRSVRLAELEVATANNMKELMLEQVDKKVEALLSCGIGSKESDKIPDDGLDGLSAYSGSGSIKAASRKGRESNVERSSAAASRKSRDADIERGSAAAPRAKPKRRCSVPHAYLFMYVVWVIMCWLIFAYGILIANLSGPGTAISFTNTWGIAYGLDQLRSTLPMVQSALLVQAIMPAVRMYIVPVPAWWSNHLDFLSCHAAMEPLEDHGVDIFGRLHRMNEYTRYNAKVWQTA